MSIVACSFAAAASDAFFSASAAFVDSSAAAFSAAALSLFACSSCVASPSARSFSTLAAFCAAAASAFALSAPRVAVRDVADADAERGRRGDERDQLPCSRRRPSCGQLRIAVRRGFGTGIRG